HKGTQLPAVTVSIGVADLDTGAPDDLLRRADTALYAAKNSGRNQVKRWTVELDTESPNGTDEPAEPTGETKRTAPADRSATAANDGARTNGKESGTATDTPAGRSARRNGGQDGGY